MGRVSKLHEYTLDKINSKFPHLKTRENYYPEWLTSPIGTRLELDVFIEELNIAAEIQGGQHSFFVPFFHGTKENFEKQKEYDKCKKIICRSSGIRLYDIATEQDADIMVYEIAELLDSLDKNKPKYFYHDQDARQKYTRITDKFSGLKQKLTKKNYTDEVDKRLKRAKEKIRMYESGELEATEEKYLFWKDIVARNGIIDIQNEYQRAIESEKAQHEKTMD
jgi:hypothetical protein